MGLQNPEEIMKKYSHQLSGGILQRCMLAGALSVNPAIIIADEPINAIDSINQVKILNEFKKIKKEITSSMIIISHNLEVISQLTDFVIVMKDGNIVEKGQTKSVFTSPQNSYTKYLLNNRLFVPKPIKKLIYEGEKNDNKDTKHFYEL